MACAVERLRQAARNAPVVLLLGRLKNEGLDPQFLQIVIFEYKYKQIEVRLCSPLVSIQCNSQ